MKWNIRELQELKTPHSERERSYALAQIRRRELRVMVLKMKVSFIYCILYMGGCSVMYRVPLKGFLFEMLFPRKFLSAMWVTTGRSQHEKYHIRALLLYTYYIMSV